VDQVPAATFDLVLDCVGGDETAAAVRACRPAGRVVIVGNLRPASGALTPALIVAAGAWVCGYRLTEHARDMPVGQDIAMLLHWIGQGTLAAPPMRTVSWTDQPAVERALADAFHPARPVLRIADDTAGDAAGGPAPEPTGGPARNAPRTQSRARRTPMASWQVVDDDGVRTATIDRPPVNALSIAALRELDAVVSGVEDDLTVRVLVLTGAGSRFFVAGADIGEAAATPPERAGERTALGQRVLARIAALPLPVIAAVNGLALGGGCELALAADIRLASTAARFGQPEVRLGIMPGFGGSQRLPRLIGMGRALDMLLSGRQVDAAAALDMGLVSQLFEADELSGGCAAYARRLRALAPDALAAIKQAAREGASTSLQAGLELEVSLSNRLRLSRDAQEGLRAFVDKRDPVFGSTRTAPGARPA
jgi:enoyl-CoA hydratase